jgi:hypothetical protein
MVSRIIAKSGRFGELYTPVVFCYVFERGINGKDCHPRSEGS